MTVTATTPRTSAVGTNDSTPPLQVVPFTFAVEDSSDVLVYLRVTATGAETLLTETTDYTVAVTGDTGGTVTMTAAVPTTSEIHVIRATPLSQTLDLTSGGDFDAESVEAALDKLTRIAADHTDELARVIRLPITEATATSLELPAFATRANKYLKFDASGNVSAAAVTPVAGTLTTTAFGESLAAAADAAAGRTLLEVGTASTLASSTDGTFATNSDAKLPTEKAVKTYVTATGVALTGDQTVAGVKTFSSSPIVPNSPSGATAAVNSAYVLATPHTNGIVAQSYTKITGAVSDTKHIPFDDTIPQVTEGTPISSAVVYTASSATNILKIDVVAHVSSTSAEQVTVALFSDKAGAGAIAVGGAYCAANTMSNVAFTYREAAGTTDQITFSVRFGGAAGTGYTNSAGSAAKYGNTCHSSITITEYKA